MTKRISVMAVGHRVKSAMKKNKLLSKVSPGITKMTAGIVRRLYNAERSEIFKDIYLKHFCEFEEIEESLADELSRKTFRAVIEYRKTYRKEFLEGITVYPQYFQNDILSPAEDEVFVDGGAYTGDTIEDYVKWGGYTGKRYMPGSLILSTSVN